MPAPVLPPALGALARSFLADRAFVTSLTDRFGSPLNVVFPAVFAANAAALRAVLDERGLSYRIHYAHKVNQAASFARAAREADLAIDVASAGELDSARQAGFAPGQIEATGPKGRAFLRLLAAGGVAVNVDNLWELSELTSLARALRRRLPVLVRLCPGGDTAAGAPAVPLLRASRFGVPARHWGEVIGQLSAARDALDFLGPSFHLDSSDTTEKAAMAAACLELFEQAWAAGLAPRVLNAGGGLRQAFTADPVAFEDYAGRLRDGLAGRGPALTWSGSTLGYRIEAGQARGIPEFHKYARAEGAPASLRALLDAALPGHGGRTLAQVLADNAIELWLEPGKALVDGAGLTLASVEFVKEAAGGELLVNLDISRDKLCPAGQEVMLDPVLIRQSAPGPATGPPVGVFLAGNLCLEQDLIFRHLTFLDRLPGPGDIMAFANTAAYQMDLSASAALMQPRAAKITVRAAEHGFAACPDRAGE